MLGRWRLPASHVSSLFYKSYCASSIPPFDKIILKQITYIKATKIYRLGSYEDCFESKLTVVEPLHYECIVRLSTSFNKVKKDLEKENLNIPLAQIRTNIDIKGENVSKTVSQDSSVSHYKKFEMLLFILFFFFAGNFCFLCIFEH